MERRSTFAATTVGNSFCPLHPVLSQRANQDAAAEKNAANKDVIPATASHVAILVIRTDEEQMIARSVCRVLGLGVASKSSTMKG